MCTNTILSRLPPPEWSYTDLRHYDDGDFKLVELSPNSLQYCTLKSKVQGHFNLGISKIVRVENPYLYGQFMIKQEEYKTRGQVRILQLYHDTGAVKIPSIVSNNLDRRLAHRVKYGKGVSFSPSPSYANKESSRNNGTARAMIVADVLVQKEQHVNTSVNLPNPGYDTTVANNCNVYVKYYDDEFYPKYVVYYTSRPHVHRGNRNNQYDDLWLDELLYDDPTRYADDLWYDEVLYDDPNRYADDLWYDEVLHG